MTTKTAYHHSEKDILLKFGTNDELVIIGDDKLVSDEDIMKLYEGEIPQGWATAPANPQQAAFRYAS